MRKKTAVWLGVSLVTILILFIGFQQWHALNPAAESLSKDEAQALIENRYDGKVTNIRLSNDQYLIEMNRNQIFYQIILDAQRGDVVSFSKMGKQVSQIEGDSEKTNTEQGSLKAKTEEEIREIISSEVTGELVSFEKISEGGKSIYKAIVMEKEQKTILKVDAHSGEILLRKTEGKPNANVLTEDDASKIALKNVKGFVDDIDLETTDDLTYYLVEVETEDEREAIIQIHAITGNVLSITWDD